MHATAVACSDLDPRQCGQRDVGPQAWRGARCRARSFRADPGAA
jgi:hypothetical protein